MDVSSETDEIVWKLIISMHTTCRRKKLAKRYYFFEKSIRFHEIIKIQNSDNLIHIFLLYFFQVPPKLTIANLKKIECEVCKQGRFQEKILKWLFTLKPWKTWNEENVALEIRSLFYLANKEKSTNFEIFVLVYSITKEGRTFPYFTSAIASK